MWMMCSNTESHRINGNIIERKLFWCAFQFYIQRFDEDVEENEWMHSRDSKTKISSNNMNKQRPYTSNDANIVYTVKLNIFSLLVLSMLMLFMLIFLYLYPFFLFYLFLFFSFALSPLYRSLSLSSNLIEMTIFNQIML